MCTPGWRNGHISPDVALNLLRSVAALVTCSHREALRLSVGYDLRLAGGGQAVAEALDGHGYLVDMDGVLDLVEVEVARGEAVEVKGEVDVHQRIYEKRAAAGAFGQLDVSELCLAAQQRSGRGRWRAR